MPASYPSANFAQRALENVAGVTFDAAKKTRYFAEDLQNLAAEIVAIQTVLGLNPNGAYTTVKDWLSSLGGGGLTLTKILSTDAVDGSRVAFSFVNLPVFCNKDGQMLDEGNGYAVAGAGPWILTFDNAPQNILSGFANL